MTVKEFLEKQNKDINIKVYQPPIKEIDSCKELVQRYYGEVWVALNSNRNYLKYELEHYYTENGILTIICKASREQEMEIINAYYDGR